MHPLTRHPSLQVRSPQVSSAKVHTLGIPRWSSGLVCRCLGTLTHALGSHGRVSQPLPRTTGMGYWPPVSAVDVPFLRSYGKQVCFGPVSQCIMTTYDNSQVHSNGVKPSVCASPAPLTLHRSPTPPKQLRTGRLCLHSRHPPEAMVVGHRRYFPSIARPLIFTIAQT